LCPPALLRPPPVSSLFPYTTLFRSRNLAGPDEFTLLPVEPELDRPAAGSRSDPILEGIGARAELDGFYLDVVSVRDVRHVHAARSEEHTSELQSRENLVCRLLLEKK